MGMLSGGTEIRIECWNYHIMDMFVSLSGSLSSVGRGGREKGLTNSKDV